MRHDETSTRLAVATLFLRVRSLRRTRDRIALVQGVESVAWQSMESQYIATWNAFQAVKTALGNGVTGMDPKDFVGAIATGARVRHNVALRDLALAA